MKIVEPSVKRINLTDRIQQIGYAASICYASDKQGSIEWLENLWKSGHKSVFRHGTRYYVIPSYMINSYIKYSLKFSPYCGFYENELNQKIFVSINEQYYVEHPYLRNYNVFECNDFNFIREAKNIDDYDCKQVLNLIRLTFEVVTQISTSRELNRVSPNNICEQSTRYCNFSKDKFGNEVSICKPWWFKDEESAIQNLYISSLEESTNNYLKLLDAGVKPEDARGVLPLDTATKCIYTYRIEEFENIINLRYYGVTGSPHPNAKIVVGKIKDIIEENYGIKFNKKNN